MLRVTICLEAPPTADQNGWLAAGDRVDRADAGRAVALYCDLMARAAIEGISESQISRGVDIGEADRRVAHAAGIDVRSCQDHGHLGRFLEEVELAPINRRGRR